MHTIVSPWTWGFVSITLHEMKIKIVIEKMYGFYLGFYFENLYKNSNFIHKWKFQAKMAIFTQKW